MLSRQGCGPPGTTVSVGRGDGAAEMPDFVRALPACCSGEINDRISACE